MKSSTALLGAWFLVVAALVFGVVYVVLQSSRNDTATTPTDAEVRPLGAGGEKPGPARPPRHKPDRARTTPPAPRQLEITGTVRNPEGETVEGARVTLWLPGKKASLADTPEVNLADIQRVNALVYIDPLDWDQPRPMSLLTETAATAAPRRDAGTEVAAVDTSGDGTYTLLVPAGVGRGPFRVTARKEDVGSAAAQGVQVGQQLDLTLGTAGQVTGQVIGEAQSLPVAGARVVFDDGEQRWTTTADEGGSFRIEGVTPGYYSVLAGAAGHTPLVDAHVQVKRGEPVVLRLPRGTTLRVTAIAEEDPQERMVEGAEIVLVENDTYAYVFAKTNAQGIAEFPSLPAGRYVLNGTAPGLTSYGDESVTIDPKQLVQEAEVRFEVAVPTTIEVVDEDGRGISGVEFYSGNADEAYDALRSLKLPGQTDAQGHYPFGFEFEGPRAALYGFKKGFSVVRAMPDDYSEGGMLRIVMKKPIRVHGRVATEDGDPVPDAEVLVEVEPDDDDDLADVLTLQFRTNAEGRYDFGYMPRSGGITIYAETTDGDGWTDEQTVEVLPGRDDYQVDLTMDIAAPLPVMQRGGMEEREPRKK